MIRTRRFRTAALTTSALCAVALPGSAPYASAHGEPAATAKTATTATTRGVTQQPGHPIILYPGRQGTAVAPCPEGTKPTGGGATLGFNPLGAVFFKESAPSGNLWRVRVYNSTDEVLTVHPRVVCSTDATLTHQVGPDSPLEPGDPNNPSTARCGDSQYVVGGGFQAGDRTYASATTWSNGNWTARAKYTNYDPDAPLSFVRAFISCSDTAAALASSGSVPVEAGEVGTAHAECPAGQVPSGGGGSGGIDVLLTTSGPTETGWTVRAKNTGSVRNTLFAETMCTAP